MQTPTKTKAGIIGFALSFYLLLQLLANFPNFVEKYYSTGLYPLIASAMSNFSSQFPFSLSEFTLWVLILFGIPFTVNRMKKKRLTLPRLALNLLTGAAIVYIWFYLFWGINYLRTPLQTTLHLDKVQLPLDAYDSTFVDIIKAANQLNLNYSMMEVERINADIEKAYAETFAELGLHPPHANPAVKSFAGNWLLNKLTTNGWFSPFFNEVHYNRDVLIFELPFVIAHEKAHQLGYTNEAEANFLAHLVCTRCEEPLIRYSGYFSLITYFMGNVRQDKERRHFFAEKISERVRLDLAAVRDRWEHNRGILSRISSRGYDLYLKANQVKEGLRSYSRVVDLVIRYTQSHKPPEGTDLH
ncbi:MAG: DUF3810 domain-containing protein [Calditrichaeota bacterium]|nr:MAG: DUF3810 domain-containing protein [Calditrichota bacterium]